MDITNKNVLIIGMARSGISAAILASEKNGNVIIYDGKGKENFSHVIKELDEYNIHFAFGVFDMNLLKECHVMILSPGVPCDLDFIQYARQKGIPVIGEVEFASQFCHSPILAITGTNGKTTTTALVGEIMKKHNAHTFVVGNIGNPFSSEVSKITDEGIVVAEISSYQLESMDQFKPKVSAFLNLTEDHLQRHKTMGNYGKIKLSITKNQGEDDFCVLNYDDKIVRSYEELVKAKVLWFSMNKEVEGAFKKGHKLYYKEGKNVEVIVGVDELRIPGDHNIENVLAAIAMCKGVRVETKIIREGILSFPGVAHRLEFVKEINSVDYYNDSKATNPDSAIKAVETISKPIVLIAGGMDKESDYTEWIQSFKNKATALVLYGETKNIIEEAAKELGYSNIYITDDLEEATYKARDIARKGDCVLLSPACASWDMFKDFEERGDLFKEIVNRI